MGEGWSTYMVGASIGLGAGLTLGWLLWKLPQLMERYMERKQRLEDVLTVAFIEQVKATPARSMAQIRDGREPEWVKPVLALGAAVFAGPPWWRVKDWFVWNFGDLLSNWSIGGNKQDSGGDGVLLRLQQADLPDQEGGQEGGPPTTGASQRVPVPLLRPVLPRWGATTPHSSGPRHAR